jgi:FkbM family methyltransferase
MLGTLSFIAKHPLSRNKPLAGFVRFARWQIESRLNDEVEVDWLEGAKLLVRNGMTGATGNIYCGLHEFADMAFLLHLLRPDDLFVDVGANIGSYTVLASAVAGSSTIAFEPDPLTMVTLRRQIGVNDISDRVTTIEAAAGRQTGTASFTTGLDTINHVATESDPNTRHVQMTTLDEALRGKSPVLIKLDVEGYEPDVVAGAIETLRNPTLLAIETEGVSAEVVRPLEAAGFARYYYEPFTRQLSATEIEGHANALFIRDRSKVEARLKAAATRTVLGIRF